MKAFPLFSLVLALSLGAAPNTGLKPVWEDNFDAKELDKAKWNVGGQARIVDGKLQVEVTPKDKPGFWNGSHAHTSKKFTYGQGYFEASIRAVQSKNRGWTVFGIRNENMTKAPAASLYFVFNGADRIEPVLNLFDEEGAQRLAPKERVIAMDGGKSYKKFLTYGLQWTATSFIWYVEGRQVHKLSRPIPKEPMYVEFHQSLPEGGLLKDFMNPKLGPEPMQVDWVKVFKIP
ncbi:MAG: glycoside hydrolase family 16 protein [Verrucomicrobiota bacterium]|jgi:beta-glucanase (GH16 family)|nr:glycoside hydrolase family 16 protein [Verrucomicrobiae bacterium]